MLTLNATEFKALKYFVSDLSGFKPLIFPVGVFQEVHFQKGFTNSQRKLKCPIFKNRVSPFGLVQFRHQHSISNIKATRDPIRFRWMLLL